MFKNYVLNIAIMQICISILFLRLIVSQLKIQCCQEWWSKLYEINHINHVWIFLVKADSHVSD